MKKIKAVRPELSFDGCGINGPDEYRTRIATFNLSYGGDVKKYGKLFAAAPEMLELLKAFAGSADEIECMYCADESWYGEGHTSACLLGCARRLIQGLDK